MNNGQSFSQADIISSGIWRCEQVACFYAPDKLGEEADYSAYVDEFWNSYQDRHPSVFNGRLLGLVGIKSSDSNELQLLVKQTSYAEYVATRSPSFAVTHSQHGRANPIGITLIAITSNEKIVVTRRSINTEQNPGMPYFIGGYVEPPKTDQLKGLICVNAHRELTEELGVVSQNAMLVIGIAMDPVYCHPELFLVTKLHVQSSSLHDLWEGASSRNEAGELLFFPVRNLLLLPHQHFFPDGVTWSFEVGIFLLKQLWGEIEALA